MRFLKKKKKRKRNFWTRWCPWY